MQCDILTFTHQMASDRVRVEEGNSGSIPIMHQYQRGGLMDASVLGGGWSCSGGGGSMEACFNNKVGVVGVRVLGGPSNGVGMGLMEAWGNIISSYHSYLN